MQQLVWLDEERKGIRKQEGKDDVRGRKKEKGR